MEDHGAFILLNIYVPNAHPSINNTTLANDDNKINESDDILNSNSNSNITDRFQFKIRYHNLINKAISYLTTQNKSIVSNS